MLYSEQLFTGPLPGKQRKPDRGLGTDGKKEHPQEGEHKGEQKVKQKDPPEESKKLVNGLGLQMINSIS